VKKQMMIAGILALVLVAGLAVTAVANVVTYVSPASGTVNVNATVNPKITLTLDTPDAAQSVAFGAIDPGAVVGGKTVNVSVNSNKAFDLAKASAGDVALLGLSTSLGDQTAVGKGMNVPFTDNYSINVPWTTDPGAYSATVQYTVTQN
jgi:hypothetical protein